jgi:hypothetical protein
MRRLAGLVLIAALMAPSLAVCAGAAPQAARKAAEHEHDCCPKDTASIAASPETSAPATACCRMSADAAQRTAIQAVMLIPPSTPVESSVVVAATAPASLAVSDRDSHPESPHIARHLLLSVLLI